MISMKTIITILNSITETSMPFNEFVIYRSNHYNEKNIVFVFSKKQNNNINVTIPFNVKIKYIGKNLIKIRRTIKEEISRCKKEKETFLIHMHQPKSAFLASLAMVGTNFYKRALFTIHSTFSGYSLHNKIMSAFTGVYVNMITFVSESAYNSYPKFIKKLKNNRIKVIINGVDIERIDSITNNKSPNYNSKIRNFIYVARMVPIKNHELLIQVIRNTNDNCKFIFVGQEDKNGNIKKLVEKYNLSKKVEFTGLLPRIEVFKKLLESTIYISPSTLEGLPISVMEAMYIGLPVILSNIKPHLEICNNSDSVTIVHNSLKEWTNAINNYSQIDSKELKKLGEKNKKHIYNNFSLSIMHQNYDKVYKDLEE